MCSYGFIGGVETPPSHRETRQGSGADVISRRTIFSLMLALLILGGLRLWVINHRDDCDRPATHLGGKPASVMVETGTRTVEMSCNEWPSRQPLAVQLVCLLDLVVGVVFLLSACSDWVRTRERGRGRRW